MNSINRNLELPKKYKRYLEMRSSGPLEKLIAVTLFVLAIVPLIWVIYNFYTFHNFSTLFIGFSYFILLGIVQVVILSGYSLNYRFILNNSKIIIKQGWKEFKFSLFDPSFDFRLEVKDGEVGVGVKSDLEDLNLVTRFISERRIKVFLANLVARLPKDRFKYSFEDTEGIRFHLFHIGGEQELASDQTYDLDDADHVRYKAKHWQFKANKILLISLTGLLLYTFITYLLNYLTVPQEVNLAVSLTATYGLQMLVGLIVYVVVLLGLFGSHLRLKKEHLIFTNRFIKDEGLLHTKFIFFNSVRSVLMTGNGDTLDIVIVYLPSNGRLSTKTLNLPKYNEERFKKLIDILLQAGVEVKRENLLQNTVNLNQP